jgi:hypothetical protein
MAVANKKAVEAAAQVHSSHTGCVLGLRRTALSDDIRLIRTVRCVRPPTMRMRMRVRTAGYGRGEGGLRVRSHCCSR